MDISSLLQADYLVNTAIITVNIFDHLEFSLHKHLRRDITHLHNYEVKSTATEIGRAHV